MKLIRVTKFVEPSFSGEGYSWGGGAVLCFETDTGFNLGVRFGEGSKNHELAQEIQDGLQAIIKGGSDK